MVRRLLRPRILEALADTPVVVVHGPRRAGKSTIVEDLASHEFGGRHVTLDDAAQRSAAATDPEGFIEGLGSPAAIDEVQRVSELFLGIKASVDRDPRPGRFLLTGSADVLAIPRVGDSLAGRVEILALRPLSQREIEETPGSAVDAFFSDGPLHAPPAPPDRAGLARRIVRGGFPEALARGSEARREAWFDSYVTTVVERDVRDLGRIEDIHSLPRLVSLSAARTAGLLNMADLARDAGLAHATLTRYLALLRGTFLVALVPPWTPIVSQRLVKAPKLHFVDSGLAARLLRVAEDALWDGGSAGRLLETFVVGEILAQASWSEARPTVSHFRVHGGYEVDIVLEDRRGRIVGVEVRAATSVGTDDFRGLRTLAEVAGRRFHRGYVLHPGREDVSFGPKLQSIPVRALWDGRVG